MAGKLIGAAIAAMLATAGAAQAQPGEVAPARPQFTQPSANVFRRFEDRHTEKMVAFYNLALGLKPLQPIQLNAAQTIILFGVGSGQIKLAPGLVEGRKYHPGGATRATGIRLFALHFSDEAKLAAQFRAAGFAAPRFRATGGGRRGALVQDPAGFSLELIIDPAATSPGVEVGINASDLEKSRAFYRSFVGLEELPPVRDPLTGVTKYPFRRGETTISLWSTGKKLPADTGSAGIQYVVGNVDAINAAALEQNVTVETPLGGLPGFTVRFVWLNDNDGVTNYFAQIGAPAK